MNTVVNKLLDVDRQARQLLDDAKQYYEKTIEEIDKEKEAIRKKYSDNADGHIAGVRQTEISAIEDAKTRISADTAEKMVKMNKTYDNSHQEWEDELFRRCTAKVTCDA